MSPDHATPAGVHSDVHIETARSSGLFALLKVALLLVLWVCGFVAFLVAPLVVLGVAWIVGVAWIAIRQRRRGGHPALPSGASAHRFGASFRGHPGSDGEAA